MAFDGLLVTEIFHSIQGETSLSGVPFAFVRLTGCNLRCTYCDSAYAFHGGQKMSIAEVIRTIEGFPPVQHVLLTGGEPLLQRNAVALVRALRDHGYQVSIETHGEVSIREASAFARIVMDVKTPSSGMCRGGWRENVPFLKAQDEVKFVIASEEDYTWAREQVGAHRWPVREIVFSPAVPAPKMPGTFPCVSARWLAEAILRDGLPVRLQLQLHKLIWGAERTGV